MSKWTEVFGTEIQTKQGIQPTEQVLQGKKYVGIYFSAHWCPPCRAFTPMLSETYEAFVEDGHNDFALVFVSSDKELDGFNGYYDQMPFYALPFENRAQKEVLAKQFQVKAIPALIFLNANGEFITNNGRNIVTNERGDPDRILAALDALTK